MKKLRFSFMMVTAVAALLFSYGCVPNRVKKEAEANKLQYEGDFQKKVAKELGPDYTLYDVEGRIMDWEGHPYVFSPDGSVSLGSRYMADNVLTGKIEHNGKVYDAQYYWQDDSMDTNAFYPAIVDDYATNLGLDKDKIIFGDLWDSESRYFIIDGEIRTASELFETYSGFGWHMDILTEEDISGMDFSDFKPQCNENEVTYGFSICIYSSDDFKNLDDFKENYKNIRWSDPKISASKPTLAYVPEEESDIFTRYNLKNAVRIGSWQEHTQFTVSQF